MIFSNNFSTYPLFAFILHFHLWFIAIQFILEQKLDSLQSKMKRNEMKNTKTKILLPVIVYIEVIFQVNSVMFSSSSINSSFVMCSANCIFRFLFVNVWLADSLRSCLSTHLRQHILF